jgi:hypothetical protein
MPATHASQSQRVHRPDIQTGLTEYGVADALTTDLTGLDDPPPPGLVLRGDTLEIDTLEATPTCGCGTNTSTAAWPATGHTTHRHKSQRPPGSGTVHLLAVRDD